MAAECRLLTFVIVRPWQENLLFLRQNFLLLRWAGGSFFLTNSVGKSPENHRLECKNAATAAVIACSKIMVRSVIRRITASDDSCVHGGLHGYKATGHAREKPNLPICAYEIGDFEIIILV